MEGDAKEEDEIDTYYIQIFGRDDEKEKYN
jgi:hypothetical protein